jgi:hypothetical protein
LLRTARLSGYVTSEKEEAAMANDRDRNQNEEAITGPKDEEMMGGHAKEESDDEDFEDVEEVEAAENEVDEE